jgi:hypothetical protein
MRRRLKPLVDAGECVCARCGRTILPGQLWDLDHVDQPYAAGGEGRRLPAHSYCNRAAGARLGNALRAQRGQRMRMSRIKIWPAVGVEVAVDRSRTWVARATESGGAVVVELLDPIVGTAAVPDQLAVWRDGWHVEVVGIDPRSPSATLVATLEEAGLPLRQVDAHAMAVAHGDFQDLLAGGRLRIRGHTALDDAARRAHERRLAGSHAVDRYNADDQAPLVAAQLAVWAATRAEKPQQFFGAWR